MVRVMLYCVEAAKGQGLKVQTKQSKSNLKAVKGQSYKAVKVQTK